MVFCSSQGCLGLKSRLIVQAVNMSQETKPKKYKKHAKTRTIDPQNEPKTFPKKQYEQLTLGRTNYNHQKKKHNLCSQHSTNHPYKLSRSPRSPLAQSNDTWRWLQKRAPKKPQCFQLGTQNFGSQMLWVSLFF